MVTGKNRLVDQIQWVGTAEAAAFLGITVRTVYRMIDDGDLPAYKIGRVIRLMQADLDAFVDSQRIEPGSLKHLHASRQDSETDPT